MRHENINTIVGILGLLIALVTAASEFWPESDKLEIVIENKLSSQQPVEYTNFGILKPELIQNVQSFGPVSWKIRISNQSDRSAAIVAYKLLQLTDDGMAVETSATKAMLSSFSNFQEELELPYNLSGNLTEAFVLSLMVPYKMDEDFNTPCDIGQKTFSQLERCFFDKGRDLFGNKIERTNYNNFETIEWPHDFESPRFLLSVETSRGDNIAAVFSYRPF